MLSLPTSRKQASWLGLLCALLVTGCGDDDSSTSTDPADPRVAFSLQSLESIPYPPDNPGRQERIALGRLLFFDPILGGEEDVSCGTCHHPQFAFADRRQFGAGASGSGLGPNRTVSRSAITDLPITLEPRNSPTILNVACNHDQSGVPSANGVQFWDGRVNSLEVQATKPIASRVEMAGDAYTEDVALDSVLNRLREIADYETLFRNAFPDEAVAFDSGLRAELIDSVTYGKAIAAYERELVTMNSAFDDYVRGNDNALTPQQLRGLNLFFGKANCGECHNGPMLSDFSFAVVGVPHEGVGKDVLPGDDAGREEHTGDPADRYAFRTPTIRNVELTPPYMHDGVHETLEEVVRFYNAGCRPRHPEVTDSMLHPAVVQPLGLTDDEVHAIVAFMKSLTDPGVGLDPTLVTVPKRVPSGLVPVFGLGDPGHGK